MTVGNLTDEKELKQENQYEQVNLFTNYGKLAEKEKEEKVKLEKEKKIQNTIIDLKNRFGKNAIIKGMDLEEDATTIQRNGQIGEKSIWHSQQIKSKKWKKKTQKEL